MDAAHILQIIQGGKLLWHAELSCNSLENFAIRCQSCIGKAYWLGHFTGKVSCLLIDP